jgi:hypothetical protein
LCPICGKESVTNTTYKSCTASHPTQRPGKFNFQVLDGYSTPLEECFEKNLKALKRGQKLSKKVKDHFEDLASVRKYYLYFVIEPMDKKPISLREFIQKIRYVERGESNRMERHGNNEVVSYFLF